jgi:hypothetical protein
LTVGGLAFQLSFPPGFKGLQLTVGLWALHDDIRNGTQWMLGVCPVNTSWILFPSLAAINARIRVTESLPFTHCLEERMLVW